MTLHEPLAPTPAPAAATDQLPLWPTQTAHLLPTDSPAGPAHAAGRRPGIAMLLATALLAGTAGGAIVALTDSGDAAPAGTTSTTSTTATRTVSLPDGSVEKVAAAVLPSVVLLQVSGPNGSGEGSGVVLSADGLILTNNHVVAGAADGGSITVRTQSGESAAATIVGRDPGSDLAVVRVSGLTLTPATLGSSADLVVGQSVLPIGAPLGLQGTVTTGIVSSLNRPVTTGGGTGEGSVLDAIQTDAAINPGNSGGALVDMSGAVVGINSAIATLGSGGGQSGSIGLGFSIPIDQAKRIADEIIADGTASRAVLGVSVGDAEGGASLTSVVDGGAAAEAGLRTGDVVTRIGERAITSADDLVAAIRSAVPGDSVTITYTRDGESATTTATLGTAEAS
jgi:putative serine protease PepD